MTFTEQVNVKLLEINEEELVSKSNIIGVAQYISELSGFMGRITQEVARRRAAYNLCLNRCLTSENKSVSYAKVAAEASIEYAELENAKALREAVVERIRGLKYLQRSMREDEFQQQ